MRIGMVVVDLPDASRVGSERRYGELIRGLRREGHDVHVFARRWGAGAARGLVCHRVPAPGPASLQALSFSLGALAALRPWRGRLDLIHSHTKSLGEDLVSPGGSAHRAYVEMLAGGAPRLRALALPWHPYHRTMIAIERLQFARARRIVLNSRWSRQVLVAAYPGAAPRTAVVYNGVDAEWFSPAARATLRVPTRRRLGLPDGSAAFLFVGAGDRRKGLLELLEAFAGLARPDARLVVVGHRDAREEARVVTALRRLGVGDRVVREPYAPDPRPYYAAADAFVLPTRFDPFSNATLEALACGLPVITTTANGVSELMTDGVEGFLLADSADRAALGGALARMMDADRRGMTQAARALAEGLTWKRHVDAMLAIYAELRRPA